MDLDRLTDADLLRVAGRARAVIGRIMDDYNRGSWPCYGWDWPTFGVLFPRRYRAWRRLLHEGKKRGLLGSTIYCSRMRRDKKGRFTCRT